MREARALAFAVAALFACAAEEGEPLQTSLTAGPGVTTRATIARALAEELTRHGVETVVTDCESTRCELDAVQARTIDFAMVSGAIDRSAFPELQEAAPLYVEALHLFVKAELALGFTDGTLRALRGRRVDLGPEGSETRWLAKDVLDFAGVACARAPSEATCLDAAFGLDELLRLERGAPRDRLPDAVFHLATVPSKIGLELIRRHDYALVPLPFARAFRLAGMLSNETGREAAVAVERRFTTEFVMPPYLYGLAPAIPPEPLSTLGARLVLVARRDLAPDLVERVVEAIFTTRFAQVPEPALHASLFDSRPRAGLHPGTRAFLARGEPFIDASDVDRIANTLSVLGALIGTTVFLWQAWRQRARSQRDRLFGGYQLELAAVEQRLAELELSAELELDALVELQRKVLRLKSDALRRFAAGELGEPDVLIDLLAPLNAARQQVGDLLLHVRENLEEQAREEGRTAEAVWQEAIEGGDDPAP